MLNYILIKLKKKYLQFFSLAYRIGELPKYLKEMKVRDAEEKKRIALIDRNCPSGHIALTNEERLEGLSIAQKSE